MHLPTAFPLQKIQSDDLTNQSTQKTYDSTAFIAIAFLNCGLHDYRDKHLDQALSHFENALQHFVQTQDEQGMGQSLNGLSAVYLETGAYDRSIAYSQAATIILQGIYAPNDYTIALHQLGMSHFRLHNLSVAQACFEQALSLYTLLNDEQMEKILLLSLGQVYTQQGQYMFALACYQAALESVPGLADPIANQKCTVMALHLMRQLCKAVYGAGAIAAYQMLITQYAI